MSARQFRFSHSRRGQAQQISAELQDVRKPGYSHTTRGAMAGSTRMMYWHVHTTFGSDSFDPCKLFKTQSNQPKS